MTAKIITVFNNKGGVGKTTLTFHMSYALSELGKKVLLVDLDPQCNLTIYALPMEHISDVWVAEDPYVEDFGSAAKNADQYNQMLSSVRSTHFCLKPTEDGTADLAKLPPPSILEENLHILPGRLTLHMYEAKVGERWSGVYTGDPLSIRTTTRIRSLSLDYAEAYGYDYVIWDTSPSLGALNRTILSLADAFIIPGAPDLFSMYGIRNIGRALEIWKKQFDSIFHFLSDEKRGSFPKQFVKFAGYTLYNAKKLTGEKSTNELGLAKAHYHYAERIPDEIFSAISLESMLPLGSDVLRASIGGNSVIWGHNTFPSMAQKYNLPMWRLPHSGILEAEDRPTIGGNQAKYIDTQDAYHRFAEDLMRRIEVL